MLRQISVKTNKRTEMLDITALVQKTIQESKVKDGVCYIYVPHTTAGITINESADPNVTEDLRNKLDRLIPFEDREYGHTEGNSAAHIKGSIVGHSEVIFIENGHLKLGTWQGIHFCEFDGPRSREIWIKID